MTFAYTYASGVLAGVTVTTSGDQAYSVTSSFSGGRLSSLSVTDDTSTLIKKVEYRYFNDVTGAHSDSGRSGDLVHVKVSMRADGDTGGTLSIVDHTLYRYASQSRLKGVYDHASVTRALAHFSQTDPEWLLTQSDDQQVSMTGPKVKDYASRWFTYYTSNLATNANITTAWGTENLQTTYGGSNRDETNFVASERVGTGCTSCGGGTSSVTHDY
jgi:hypothetical protein